MLPHHRRFQGLEPGLEGGEPSRGLGVQEHIAPTRPGPSARLGPATKERGRAVGVGSFLLLNPDRADVSS